MPLFGPRQREEALAPAQASRRGQTTYLGLRASAARLAIDNKKLLSTQSAARQEWQDEAWEYFDDIGEIKYTARLAGNVMSKLRFYVAVNPPEDPEADPIAATDEGSHIPMDLALRAQEELERLKSPMGGRAELVRMLYINLEVAAECYLVCIGPRRVSTVDVRSGTAIEDVIPESWEIKSVDEVDASGAKVKIRKTPGDTAGTVLDPAQGDAIIRIWERHPRWAYLPDNAMRGVLGICESLVLLENQVKAIAKSHASAGFFTLPNELELLKDATRVPEGEGEQEEGTSPFLEAYHETLGEPIENPSSAASVAPLPITGPAEYLKPDYVRHISLARPSDATLDARIEGRVLRMARGLNYPVETVLGHQQTTFANASQIDDDKFKDHYEPRAVLICDAWTVGFLRPNLIEAGYPPELVDQLFVWFDASAIVRGVDPAETALEGWNIGAISDAAWRRVRGWTEDDAPDPVETLLRATLKLRTLDPGLSTAILELLGVPLDIPSAVPAGPQGPDTDVPNPPDTEDTPTPPTQSINAPPGSLAEALLMYLAAHRRGELPHPEVARQVRAAATPKALRTAQRALNNPGRQLMELDRELRARVQTAAHSSMTRSLERAGNRLKTKLPKLSTSRRKATGVANREMVMACHARYATAMLGPKLVAAAGITDDELITADSWDGLETQYMAWAAEAQRKALSIVGRVVPMSTEKRAHLQDRQARDLASSWEWLRDALDGLARVRLYHPDPAIPPDGEYDDSTVPVSMIRQALAIAGGATGLEPPRRVVRAASGGNDTFVVLNNGDPPGGIGTGELIDDTLSEGGASTEAWQWDYGPAFRKFPFEEHEQLDGITFESFDDSELDASSSWVDSDNYFPGDHDGCCCDIVPIIIGPGDVAFNEATGEGVYLDQQPGDEGDELLAAVMSPETYDAGSAATFQD